MVLIVSNIDRAFQRGSNIGGPFRGAEQPHESSVLRAEIRQKRVEWAEVGLTEGCGT